MQYVILANFTSVAIEPKIPIEYFIRIFSSSALFKELEKGRALKGELSMKNIKQTPTHIE